MESKHAWNIGFWGKMNEEMLNSLYPVHRACRDGDQCALSSLLSDGKHDLYTEDQFYGWTPAHWAGYYGKLECLQLLIAAGVNSEVTTQRFRQSPAHVAAFGSQPHCLMWLVQNGANVNAQDYLGETPSHKAARSGSLECLGILKANGAQFRIKNNNGHVARDLAISCGNETSARYIIQVEESCGMNGTLLSNGLCSRKRGISEIDEDEIKKARADPSMPFAPPITQTTDKNMVPLVPDGLPGGELCPELLEVCAEPMDSVSYENDRNQSLGVLPEPEATSAQGHVCRNDVVAPSRQQNESWKYGDCEMISEETAPATTQEVTSNTVHPTSVRDTTPSIPLKGPMGDCGQWQRDYWMECYVPHQAPHRCVGLRDNLCSDLISNGLPSNATPNGLSAQNIKSATNGSSAVFMNGSGDASEHSSHQTTKEYVRVYDYLTNWSAYSGACENNKTLVTDEMETQDTDMTDVERSDGGTCSWKVSNSAAEHKESIAQAQGYDSKLCESMYEMNYGHAY